MKENKLTVSTEVPIERVAMTLVGAVEGGSTYWMESIDWGVEFKDAHKKSPFKDKSIGGAYSDVLSWAWKEHYDFRIKVTADEDADWQSGIISPRTIQRGVQLMARDHTRHFDDMVRENDDATTSDVLLQCIVFHEVVFG